MMRKRRRHVAIITVLAAVLAGSSASASVAKADTAGTIHFVRSADSAFDTFTSNPSGEAQAWLRSHMWRMIVWSPYFDQRTSWYGEGWVYKDAYAIYKESQLASEHPDWILKDASGRELYIPYGCAGGSCPQYAGDITNPEFRRYWIEEAKSELAHGYRGLFIDDVNMEERVGNGQGEAVNPISGVTHQALNSSAWRSALAQFMVEVRAALPGAEIVHNAIWFADGGAGTSDPSIRQEIESANFINLERGVNDSGLTGGSGPWSLNALFSYADEIHALGRAVILDGAGSEAAPMEYNLASYLLLSAGGDAVSASGQTPNNWWSGWSVNLGEAAGPRYAWQGLLRRDFTGGLVLVNPPGEPTRTVALPVSLRQADGTMVSSVSVSGGSGVVLTGTMSSPASAPPTASPTPVPTSTSVETQLASTTTTAQPTSASVLASTGQPASKAATPVAATKGSVRSPAASRNVVSHRRHHRKGAHRRRRGSARRMARAAGSIRAPGARTSRISGTVAHATRGWVVIELDRWVGGRWRLATRFSARVNASGHFLRLIALRGSRRYRVRASYTGARGYLPSSSPYRLVRLRPA